MVNSRELTGTTECLTFTRGVVETDVDIIRLDCVFVCVCMCTYIHMFLIYMMV